MGTRYDQLVADARKGAGQRTTPLDGSWSHRLFEAEANGRPAVVKVFTEWSRDEPQREWESLQALRRPGFAPQPLHLALEGGPPVIVMTRLDARARPFDELTDDELEWFNTVHWMLRSVKPKVRRPANGHPDHIVRLATSLLAGLAADGGAGRPAASVEAVTRADAWLRGDGARSATNLESDEVWCRGDTNWANALWAEDGRVFLVDFEDAGYRPSAFEAIELVEHVANRDLSDERVEDVLYLWGLEPDSRWVQDGRRLAACFWLGVVEDRARRGGADRSVTPEQQATRVLELLG